MSLSHAPNPTPLGVATADALLDSYAAWREATSDVHAAYDRWARSAPTDRDLAFAAYMAALQQEEHAAHRYQRQVERGRPASRAVIYAGSPGDPHDIASLAVYLERLLRAAGVLGQRREITEG